MQKNNYKLYETYYDAMEFLGEGQIGKAKELLQKILKKDTDFIDAYNGLVAVYEDEGNEKKAIECANLSYLKTKENFPKWPNEMMWGELDNRKYLRAIYNKATYLHRDGKIKEAEELYRLLLKMNPFDSQGVRYLLAALLANEHPGIVDDLMEEGDSKQDWSKLENLLEKQNKKYKFWGEGKF